MHNIRRGYIYLACLASLQAVSWAVISLLRNVLLPNAVTSLENTALQIAIIIVGLPIFLVHWLWAQRLARRDVDERESIVRRLYLYGVMSAFLGPFLPNALDLLDSLLRLASGLSANTARYSGSSWSSAIIAHLSAMLVLALLWFYHWRIVQDENREIPDSGNAATVRRLFTYSFSAAGLVMTTLAIVALSRWLMVQISSVMTITHRTGMIRELARLAVGLPLWLLFWQWAQRRFAAPDEEERASALRKIYLYLAVFFSVLATVVDLTIVLRDILARLMGHRASGSGDIREALSILFGAVLVWAYHAYILRRDGAVVGELASVTWVPQLYHYLVATIGLGALLIGLAGNISLIVRALVITIVHQMPEEAAWFTALILAGLPVWILPWRRLQLAATTPGSAGDAESRAVIRKIYLYFYLLLATLTVLGSGVYIVSRLLGLLLGVRQSGNLLADLGRAIAYSVIAVGVWLYHGFILRADDQRNKAAQVRHLSQLCVAVLSTGDESLDRTLVDELRRGLPGLNLETMDAQTTASPADLAEVNLIVGPWTILMPGDEATKTVIASPAPKVLLPVPAKGWHWASASEEDPQEAVHQAVRAVKQFAAGEEIQAKRKLGAGAIVAIVVGGLILISLVINFVSLLTTLWNY